jgi:hypothetical protein
MRVAVMIIALCLVMVLGVHSCAVGIGSSIIGDKATADAGAYGVFLAFLFILGAAFVLKLPGVSAAIFLVGGVIAIVGNQGVFSDLSVWGGVSIVLGIMALLGRSEGRQRLVRVLNAPPYGPEIESDGSVPVMQSQVVGQRGQALPWLLLIAVLLVAGLGIWLYAGGFLSVGRTAASVDQRTPSPVAASDLLEAYSANEVAAQLRYGDKLLDVDGLVKSITLADGAPVIDLGDANRDDLIRTEFTAESALALAPLKVGDPATFRCSTIRKVAGVPTLSGCIVPPTYLGSGNDVGLLTDDDDDETTEPASTTAASNNTAEATKPSDVSTPAVSENTSFCGDAPEVKREAKSLDGGYLYQQLCYAPTTDLIIQIRVADGVRRSVGPGNSLMVIRSGEYRGYLLLERHKYHAEGGSYDATFVVRPDGKEMLEVPKSADNRAAVEEWLTLNGWSAS